MIESVNAPVAIKQTYQRIVDLLSYRQFVATIGSPMSYQDKIQRVRKVSKSRKVLALCSELEVLLSQVETKEKK